LFWLLPQFLLLPLALLDRATNAIQHGVARCSAVAIELTGPKADAVSDAPLGCPSYANRRSE